MQYYSLFGTNNQFNIAKDIGKEFSNVKDQLLNVLQIKNQKKLSNLDLKNYAAIGEKYTEIIEGIIVQYSLSDFDKANLLPTKLKTGIAL